MRTFRESCDPFSASTHAHGRQRLAHAPRARHEVLRTRPRCRRPPRGREFPNDPRRNDSLGCLSALRRASDRRAGERVEGRYHRAARARRPPATLASGAYRDKEEPAIESTGYVIHSLEAALWCFARPDSSEGAILAATNLGYDADTIASICGADGIPERWRVHVAMRERIEVLAAGLLGAG